MSGGQDGEAIDFEKAQFAEPAAAGVVCSACGKPPGSSYFSLNGQSICAECLAHQRAAQQSSFVKALALGTAAGAVGALVYYGIRAVTGYDLALITIGLGILVGLAVRRGAGSSTHVIYRILAVGLAWVSMCMTYVPMIVAGMLEGEPAAGFLPWIVGAVLSLAVPFLLISEMEILGVLIFGFGLWEAFRLSAPRPFVVEGPFTLAEPAARPEQAVAAPPA